MNHILARFVLAVPLAGVAFGQAPLPEFEVATVKLNKSGDAQQQGGGMLPGGQFSVRNLPLKGLLGTAFNEPNQFLTGMSYNDANQRFLDAYIVGAPAWAESDRFDLVGKAPPDTPMPTLLLMLRSLLEKEFKLKSHQETRPMDVYSLVVGKQGKSALKIQPSTATGPRACRRIQGGTDDPEAKGLTEDQAGFVCAHTTMPELVQVLPRWAPAYIDRVVVDATELQGPYDIKVVWVSRQLVDQGGLNVFDALTKVGLKLDARKQPMPVLVIDHIERLDADR